MKNVALRRHPFGVAALLGLLLAITGNAMARESSGIQELRRDAEAGDANAQLKLGAAFDSGTGVKADLQEAAKWYLAAAEKGNAAAQNSIGSLYLAGQGVPRDSDKAFEWFNKSAQQGDVRGIGNLAYMYDSGRGISRDQKKATELYEQAANAGDIQSMLNVGVNYWHGEGTDVNLTKAFMWLDLARFYTQSGNANRQLKWNARGALDALSKVITPAERTEGQRLSREWDQANRSKVLAAPKY